MAAPIQVAGYQVSGRVLTSPEELETLARESGHQAVGMLMPGVFQNLILSASLTSGRQLSPLHPQIVRGIDGKFEEITFN